MKQASGKNLVATKFLGWIFGVILSPFSIVAAITVPVVGIILLALNAFMIWVAIQSSKELKLRKTITKTQNHTTNQSPNPFQNLPTQTTPSVAPKEPTIHIPDTIGEYKLEYHYRDVPFTVLGDLDNTVGGEDLTFSIASDEIYIYIGENLIGLMKESRQKDMVRDFLKRSEPIKAILSAFDGELTAKMFIAFYRIPKYKRLMGKGSSFTTFKLTNIGKEEFQDNIGLCSVGESVEYSFEYEKEKYLASCGLDIGYFPKKANELLECGAEAYISSIEEDEYGKYTIFVSVFD